VVQLDCEGDSLTSKEIIIIKRLKSEGWEFVSQAGSYTKWKHPN
jgi:predicted RNA binding protein YcfA (HicA-like mRNA interferase family)